VNRSFSELLSIYPNDKQSRYR